MPHVVSLAVTITGGFERDSNCLQAEVRLPRQECHVGSALDPVGSHDVGTVSGTRPRRREDPCGIS